MLCDTATPTSLSGTTDEFTRWERDMLVEAEAESKGEEDECRKPKDDKQPRKAARAASAWLALAVFGLVLVFNVWMQKVLGQDSTQRMQFYNMFGTMVLSGFLAGCVACVAQPARPRIASVPHLACYYAVVLWVITIVLGFVEPNTQWQSYATLKAGVDAADEPRVATCQPGGGISVDGIDDNSTQGEPVQKTGVGFYAILEGADWSVAVSQREVFELPVEDTEQALLVAPIVCGSGAPSPLFAGCVVSRGAAANTPEEELARVCRWGGPKRNATGVRLLTVSPSFGAYAVPEGGPQALVLYEYDAPSLAETAAAVEKVEKSSAAQYITALLVYLAFTLPVTIAATVRIVTSSHIVETELFNINREVWSPVDEEVPAECAAPMRQQRWVPVAM
ncbi:hypothetical protein DIPPA_21589 [Diplonema papillatum]|nr:hypothetical protein DIPPA_21589 [Diplonema papillatum]KAJ9472887.1 hypothetical protein DIPPA_21589 [Diplonema papillatum]